MRSVRIIVPGDARPFGSKTTRFIRDGKPVGGQGKTAKAKRWEDRVASSATDAMSGSPQLFEGPISVKVACIFGITKGREMKRSRRPREWKAVKPDVDKIARLVLDGLEGVVYPHDACVVRLEIIKFSGAQGEPARTIIVVKELGEFQ